jgi:rod shape-determining protein MreD
MRYALYAVLVAASLVLQVTWLGLASIGGAVADPVLVIVMTVGLLHGSEEGMLVGAGAGLLQDVMTGSSLGLGMLANLCVGYVAGLGERSIYVENLWLPALAAACLTVVRNAVWIGAGHLAILLQAPPGETLRLVAAAACYNGGIAVPIFHGLRRLDSVLVGLYERPR